MSALARINELAPWLSLLVVGALAFLVGKHFQREEREERKQRELRRQQQTRVVFSNVIGSMVGTSNAGWIAGSYVKTTQLHPAEENPQENPQGLGRLQDQPVQSRFTN